MRKWTKERFSRLMVSREEDIKEEEETTKRLEGPSEMQDAQMSGVTWKAAETGLATEGSEGSSEEEWIRVKKKSRNGISDSDRRLGFVPYAEFTYKEVLRSKPGYAKFLIEEGNEIIRKEDLRTGRWPVWRVPSPKEEKKKKKPMDHVV